MHRVGNLRFNLPQAVDAYNGTYTVQDFGPACPQQAFDFPEFSGLAEDVIDLVVNTAYNAITPSDEDCAYSCAPPRPLPSCNRYFYLHNKACPSTSSCRRAPRPAIIFQSPSYVSRSWVSVAVLGRMLTSTCSCLQWIFGGGFNFPSVGMSR